MSKEIDDVSLAQVLLGGTIGLGTEDFDYLVKGSKEEYEARKALVRVLLSKKGPTRVLLRQIDALFDPDPLKDETCLMVLWECGFGRRRSASWWLSGETIGGKAAITEIFE
jgi:hypothetical protein